MFVCILLCTSVAHGTAQNNSDILSSYSPDNYHNLGIVYWIEQGMGDQHYRALDMTTGRTQCYTLLAGRQHKTTGH